MAEIPLRFYACYLRCLSRYKATPRSAQFNGRPTRDSSRSKLLELRHVLRNFHDENKRGASDSPTFLYVLSWFLIMITLGASHRLLLLTRRLAFAGGVVHLLLLLLTRLALAGGVVHLLLTSRHGCTQCLLILLGV